MATRTAVSRRAAAFEEGSCSRERQLTVLQSALTGLPIGSGLSFSTHAATKRHHRPRKCQQQLHCSTGLGDAQRRQ